MNAMPSKGGFNSLRNFVLETHLRTVFVRRRDQPNCPKHPLAGFVDLESDLGLSELGAVQFRDSRPQFVPDLPVFQRVCHGEWIVDPGWPSLFFERGQDRVLSERGTLIVFDDQMPQKQNLQIRVPLRFEDAAVRSFKLIQTSIHRIHSQHMKLY